MTIEHIVLGAGGPVGLVSYGILRELTENNFIKYENIKSIYATSIGTFIGLIYILNIEWDWIDDYLIKRPWEQLLNFTSNDYLCKFFKHMNVTRDHSRHSIACQGLF